MTFNSVDLKDCFVVLHRMEKDTLCEVTCEPTKPFEEKATQSPHLNGVVPKLKSYISTASEIRGALRGNTNNLSFMNKMQSPVTSSPSEPKTAKQDDFAFVDSDTSTCTFEPSPPRRKFPRGLVKHHVVPRPKPYISTDSEIRGALRGNGLSFMNKVQSPVTSSPSDPKTAKQDDFAVVDSDTSTCSFEPSPPRRKFPRGLVKHHTPSKRLKSITVCNLLESSEGSSDNSDIDKKISRLENWKSDASSSISSKNRFFTRQRIRPVRQVKPYEYNPRLLDVISEESTTTPTSTTTATTTRSTRPKNKDFSFNSSETESDEELKKAILESKRIDDAKKKLDAEAAKLPMPSSGIPLKEKMLQSVKNSWKLSADTKIVTKFSMTIRQTQLAGFRDQEWLEDLIIDFYLEMIKARNEKMRSKGFNYPKIFVFHSFFFKLCSKHDFDAVKEAASDNIFEYDLAFFPIIISDHWRLIVADFKRKRLSCYDSMFRTNDNNLRIITKYLEQEYKLKVEKVSPWPEIPETSAAMSPESEPEVVEICNESGSVLTSESNPSCHDVVNDLEVKAQLCENVQKEVARSTSILAEVQPVPPRWETYFRDWTVGTVDPSRTSLPLQKNGYDCGIFLCQYAESLARGVDAPFDFSQVNMLYFRNLMAYETIHGRLVPRGRGLRPQNGKTLHLPNITSSSTDSLE